MEELRVQLGDDNVPFLRLGEHQMRLELEDLDEKYLERAKNELRETPEVVESALCRFKEMIQGEPGLNVPLDDRKFLIKFLRPLKFYPDSGFKTFKKFYKFKAKYPKYGQHVTPSSVRHVFDNEVIVYLPTRTPSGSRIMIINAGTKWNPKIVTLPDILRTVMVGIEIAMMEPKTQVGGVQVIINMEGFSMSHIYQISPSMAKLIMYWVQECAPTRLKGIHIINQSFIFNMAYAIFKPFISEKLRRRLYFHGSNKKTLCEHISPEALPKSLGGEDGSLDYPGRLFSEILFFYEDLCAEYNTYGYAEDKVSVNE